MAYVEDALNTFLLTQTAITAYVGTDIFHTERPDELQSDFITYQVVTTSNDPLAFSVTDTAQPSIQIDVFSKNNANAIAIGNLLVTALNGLTSMTGLTLIQSRAQGPEVSRDPDDEQWYHGIVIWDVEYVR